MVVTGPENTVKPILNGISRAQNIFLLKLGFRLMKVYYDSHRTWKYSKTCLKRNIKGPEHFSAEAKFPVNQGVLW
jgi:hypothetical protein